MATKTTTKLKASVKSAINKVKNKRETYSNTANGTFLLTGSVPVVAADYDVVGDVIELFEFPPDTYLLGASVVADKDYDTGGTAIRTDLVAKEGTSFTSGVGIAFGNQPANDAVEVLSSDAADTTQTVTIIGTTTATDTVVLEDIVLNGTTPVASVKTDWGFILAVKISAVCAGTITVQEASADADITTIATGILQKGVETVTTTTYHSRLVDLVCSGTGTKSIGIKGTDGAGSAQYDAQALNGVTVVQSNLPFTTVTEIYTGDLESSRTVTVNPGDVVLAAASAVFSTNPPTPLNAVFTANGSEYATNVGDAKLCVRINVAPTTANTGTVTLTYKALVYHGRTSAF